MNGAAGLFLHAFFNVSSRDELWAWKAGEQETNEERRHRRHQKIEHRPQRKSKPRGMSSCGAIPAISGDLGVHGDLSGLPGVFSLDSSGTAGLPWVWNRHIIHLLWPFLFDQSGEKGVGPSVR
jgi:hypothetical protein